MEFGAGGGARRGGTDQVRLDAEPALYPLILNSPNVQVWEFEYYFVKIVCRSCEFLMCL